MKPSEVTIVKARPCWFMAIMYGFTYLMWKGKVLADSSAVEDFNNAIWQEHLRTHETIHARQALSINTSKWTPYYKEYIKEWFGNLSLITVNMLAPYKFMPMELEAFGMEYESDYIFYADGMPRSARIWEQIKKDIPVKKRKELAKKWYSNRKSYKNFSEFVNKEVFSLIEV